MQTQQNINNKQEWFVEIHNYVYINRLHKDKEMPTSELIDNPALLDMLSIVNFDFQERYIGGFICKYQVQLKVHGLFWNTLPIQILVFWNYNNQLSMKCYCKQ